MERQALAENINNAYGRYMQDVAWKYFDKIGFLNTGYWNVVEDNLERAQISLMETLARFLHNKDGNILDVGCGKGASTKFLTKYFDPAKITGINVTVQQLEVCKVLAPECTFKLMDATKLAFDSASFGNILCIEAAFHFLTRSKFFDEAYRVLKPAGRLAMLDVLCDNDKLEALDKDYAALYPRENYLPNLDAYREALLAAGFRYVRVEDCTDLTANAACRYVTRLVEEEFDRTQDPAVLERSRRLARHYDACSPWCLVYAIK